MGEASIVWIRFLKHKAIDFGGRSTESAGDDREWGTSQIQDALDPNKITRNLWETYTPRCQVIGRGLKESNDSILMISPVRSNDFHVTMALGTNICLIPGKSRFDKMWCQHYKLGECRFTMLLSSDFCFQWRIPLYLCFHTTNCQ